MLGAALAKVLVALAMMAEAEATRLELGKSDPGGDIVLETLDSGLSAAVVTTR